MADPLLALLDSAGARPALVVPDDGTRRSHAELAETAAGLAGGLAAAGVGRGDRVAAVLGERPEPVVLLFALGLLGAAMASLNPADTEPELRSSWRTSGRACSSSAGAPAGGGRRRGRRPGRRARESWDGSGPPRALDRCRALRMLRPRRPGLPRTPPCSCTRADNSRPKQVPLCSAT